MDAAQGAEEMVEHLTEKTLQQEDQIQTLEEEKADLVRRLMAVFFDIKKNKESD